MKILYILGTLMFLGIFMILICSLKVLNDMNTPQQRTLPGTGPWSPQGKPQQKTQVRPGALPYVIGTYLGMAFFVVGALGSIVAVFQVGMRRF